MKLQLTTAATLTTLLALTGCSSSSEPSEEMTQISNQQTEIETLKTQQAELKAELETIKPDVEQFASMQSELTLLVQEAEALREEKAMMALEEERKQHEARSFYMVQTFSLSSLDRVKKARETQTALYPEILTGLPARYQKVTIDGRDYYRLKMGEYDQKAGAIETCQALITQQASCIVVNNNGIKL